MSTISAVPRRTTNAARKAAKENDENAATMPIGKEKPFTGAALAENIVAKAAAQQLATKAGNNAARNRSVLGDVSNIRQQPGAAGKAAKKVAVSSTETQASMPAATSTTATAGVTKPTTRRQAAVAAVRVAASKQQQQQQHQQQQQQQQEQQADKDMMAEPSVQMQVHAETLMEIDEVVSTVVGTAASSLEQVPEETMSIKREDDHNAMMTSACPADSDADVGMSDFRGLEALKRYRGVFNIPGYEDLDKDDGDDPLMVAEYADEIFEYQFYLEPSIMASSDYMDRQPELQWKMRSILVDWLVDVHWKFRLLPETLFLTVSILDRFLSLRQVALVKLQLVGICALLVASKYEEVYSPTVDNLLYMADNGYKSEEVLKMERHILYVLEFNLGYPSPMNFLRRASKAENYDIQTRTLAKYFMEVTLLDHRFIQFAPSLISAASLWLARKMLNRGDWNANLVHYSGYEEKELTVCCDTLVQFLMRPTKQEAIFKKYSSSKFMKASLFVKDYLAREHTA